jgi:hypothetical protein
MRSTTNLLKLTLLVCTTTAPSFGWWCEGHEVVALIAEQHLSANARAMVTKLLKENPAAEPRFCKDSPDDPMALASTWADDAKSTEKTGAWHYMDIPVGLKRGDPEKYCEAIGPSRNGGERPGCVLSALRYAVNVLHSKDETAEEQAKALRYLIHLLGDLHQPMHTTSNNDQGGNCTPVQFFDDPKVGNLHRVWDGEVFNKDLAAHKETLIQFAADLDQRFAGKRAGWVKNTPDFDKWAWEGHMIARETAYGDLDPKPPFEAYDPKPNCKAEAETFGALHIKIGDAYQSAAAPVVEEQLAKAGYRLAAVLDMIWP